MRLIAIDSLEPAKTCVISDQRRCLLFVDIEPIGNRSGLVIIALIEIAAADGAARCISQS